MDSTENLELMTKPKVSQISKPTKSSNYWLTEEEKKALREQSKKDMEIMWRMLQERLQKEKK